MPKKLNGYEIRKLAIRKRILQAAVELVRATGGTEFSMIDLAVKAGVSPATPFNHFHSKKGIFGALINQTLLDRPEPASGGFDCIGRVIAIMMDITRFYSEDPLLYRPVFCSIISEVNRSSPGLQTAIKKILNSLSDARASGEIRKAVDLELLAELIESYWMGSLLFWINGSIDASTWIHRVEHGLSLMLHGVVTDQAALRFNLDC